MEKKEMSFAEKFEAAGKELEKEIKDGCSMILIANNNGGSETYVNIEGNRKGLSVILAYVALKSDRGFDEILANAVKTIELYKKHNK